VHVSSALTQHAQDQLRILHPQLTFGHLQGALSMGDSLVRKDFFTFFTPA
jgi:hypothetical protein